MHNCSGLIIKAKVLHFAYKGWDGGESTPEQNYRAKLHSLLFSIGSFSLFLFSAEGSHALWTDDFSWIIDF